MRARYLVSIEKNYLNVQHRIDLAVKNGQFGSKPVLLAVTKGRSLEEVQCLIDIGHVDFAENYVNESVEKFDKLQLQNPSRQLVWHFIGALQSNKAHLVAKRFDWFHSLDRPKLLARLAGNRPTSMAPLNICIQVNIDGSERKSGLPPIKQEIEALGRQIGVYENLRWRGLMCIPDAAGSRETQEKFNKMNRLFKALQVETPTLDVLSMGMSRDFEHAIQAGATHVRVGTALFEKS